MKLGRCQIYTGITALLLPLLLLQLQCCCGMVVVAALTESLWLRRSAGGCLAGTYTPNLAPYATCEEFGPQVCAASIQQ